MHQLGAEMTLWAAAVLAVAALRGASRDALEREAARRRASAAARAAALAHFLALL